MARARAIPTRRRKALLPLLAVAVLLGLAARAAALPISPTAADGGGGATIIKSTVIIGPPSLDAAPTPVPAAATAPVPDTTLGPGSVMAVPPNLTSTTATSATSPGGPGIVMSVPRTAAGDAAANRLKYARPVPLVPSAVFVTDVDMDPVSLAVSDAATDPETLALRLAETVLQVPASELRVRDVVKTATGVVPRTAADAVPPPPLAPHPPTTNDGGVVTAVYLRQVVHGLDVANGDLNVNVDAKTGRVVGYGDRLFHGIRPVLPPFSSGTGGGAAAVAAAGLVTPEDAFAALAAVLGIEPDVEDVQEVPTIPSGDDTSGTTSAAAVAGAVRRAPVFELTTPATPAPVSATFAYLQTSAGELVLVYEFTVDLGARWYSAHVNAGSAKVESVVNWAADASYAVLPPQADDDPAQIRVVEILGTGTAGSPLGWHDMGVEAGGKFTDTRGNNVLAEENRAGNAGVFGTGHRPDGGAGLAFLDVPDLSKDPADSDASAAAATTSAFFWTNLMHDVAYRFGFDEQAGNFQQNNLGRGGLQFDAVQATVQDGGAPNNAYFATPPDGYSPRLVAGIFASTTPRRDTALDVPVLVHEYTHGIASRLTGGPSNANCLGTLESGGLNEGWADTLALVLTAKPTDTRTTPRVIGAWVSGNPATGLRAFPYSADALAAGTNPHTFAYVARQEYHEVHRLGEVWAAVLWEVYWACVDMFGFRALVDPSGAVMEANGGPMNGNEFFTLVVLNALKLQPCNPTFVEARDAILLAEAALTGDGTSASGRFACLLWFAFAKRGLGVGAAGSIRDGFVQESFEVPEWCPQWQ
ncbi:hypothetical protein H9P43_005090 [Blastocladiella emersonii ATCC 22665]|nr:hypothetical protein H9P43_005090 [Blastocladiella emersonii ATCC 22665]